MWNRHSILTKRKPVFLSTEWILVSLAVTQTKTTFLTVIILHEVKMKMSEYAVNARLLIPCHDDEVQLLYTLSLLRLVTWYVDVRSRWTRKQVYLLYIYFPQHLQTRPIQICRRLCLPAQYVSTIWRRRKESELSLLIKWTPWSFR